MGKVHRINERSPDGQAQLLSVQAHIGYADEDAKDSTQSRVAVDWMNEILASWYTMRNRVVDTLPSIDSREGQCAA